jgi:tetratricopeptide (TPR) repeat protein
LKAAQEVHKVEPTFSLAKNLGKIAAKNGRFDEAEKYFNEASGLAATKDDKVEAGMLLGDLAAQRGLKPSAREQYRKVLGIDGGNKEAFEKIGDLYMNSFTECAKKNNYAEDRLIYIAAYEMYAKAGNGQKMANAKSQFPSVSEIFEQGWSEGESKKIDCWVGETVILKTRGKD